MPLSTHECCLSSTDMAELDALRTVARARELCEKVEQERRVTALVLILRHLADHGYLDSYERLTKESGVTLAKVPCCYP